MNFQRMLIEGIQNIYEVSLAEAMNATMEIMDILKKEKIKIPKDAPFIDVKPHPDQPDKFVYVTDAKSKKVIMMKFSKFISKLVKSSSPGISEKDLQKIQRSTGERMKTIGGDFSEYTFEIWKKPSDAYKASNYCKSTVASEGKAGLVSCMTGKASYLKMYDATKDINEFVMLDKKKKIVARAVLWKNILIGGGKGVFLDRIYFAKEEHKLGMMKEAGKNGWYNRTRQSYSDKDKISKKGSSKSAKMMFYVPLDKFTSHPFLDTMSYALYDTEKKAFCLSNVPADELN